MKFIYDKEEEDNHGYYDVNNDGEESEVSPLVAKRTTNTQSRYRICIGVTIAVFLVATLISVVSVATTYHRHPLGVTTTSSKPAKSEYGYYGKVAVASDSAECSSIGRDILENTNGSLVDAAIATSICVGLYNMQSAGIGGGFFMNVYERPNDGAERIFSTLDSREVAPLEAYEGMFYNKSSRRGPVAIAVPGEIAGYYAAWSHFGRVPWRRLFEPSIRLARDGYIVSKELATKIGYSEFQERDPFPVLWDLIHKADGTPLQAGDVIKRPELARTLQRIADRGGDEFYTGPLADEVVQDIQEIDGIINHDDLQNYKPIWRAPLEMTLENKKVKVVSMDAPSGGAVFNFMIRLLDDYDMDSDMLSSTNKETLLHHRMAEVFKFGYSLRSYMADPDFVNITEVRTNLTSLDYIRHIRSRIDDDRTHDISYYHPLYTPPDGGTSHISILSADGAAVALTTTINGVFGSAMIGRRTGILFNNEMNDFATAEEKNMWGAAPSLVNKIEPGKRPVSSMCPALLTDGTDRVVAVVGASGGIIIPTTALTSIYNSLWLDMNIADAVDAYRLHHQLIPNILYYESGFDQAILRNLEAKGHELGQRYDSAICQAVINRCYFDKVNGKVRAKNGDYKVKDECLAAVSDHRKGGKPDGL